MASVTVPKHIRRRRRLKAAGLCFWCGNSKADRGWRKRCSSCLEKHRSYPSAGYTDKKKRDRQERARRGLCMYCGKHPATEGKRCSVCKKRDNAKHREWLKKTAADRVAKGLCKDCGKNPLSSTMYCVGCLNKRLYQISNLSDEKKKLRNERLKKWYLKMRLIVIDHYTQRKRECACCGEKMLVFLTIDHVNNDGNIHRKTVATGSLPRWIIKNNFPKDFQILCFNCNVGKRINGGVCPHETKGVDNVVQGKSPVIERNEPEPGTITGGTTKRREKAQSEKSKPMA